MDIWSYTQEGYNKDDTVLNGNRFLIGNGYMGYRGTMDEWGKHELAAINLAGSYDRNGEKWREPINAPNGLFAHFSINGKSLALDGGGDCPDAAESAASQGKTMPLAHSQTVHFRKGLHMRDTTFEKARLGSLRFVSMSEPHLLVSRLTLEAREDGKAELYTGIVTDIWDINGPHLFGHTYQTGEIIQVQAKTGELGIPIAVAQGILIEFAKSAYEETQEVTDSGVFRKICFDVRAGESYVFTLISAVYTKPNGGNDPSVNAYELCKKALEDGFERLLQSHEKVWEKLWKNSAVELSGCDEAARALNASLYHLHSIAPRHADNLSIPARGLSGQTYKGAIFWDAEIFKLPMFTATEPEVAKSMLRYRIETLPGALRKAAEYGYRGAFYPWESQEGGVEGCTDFNVVDVFTSRPVRTYFRDKQIHISGDIAHAIWKYYETTGDVSLLMEGGAEVILQCARFYLTRAHQRLDTCDVEILDVIGPDEYHERVNNNAFTNQMAAFCMSCALGLKDVFDKVNPNYYKKLVKRLDFEEDLLLIKYYYPKLRPVFKEGVVIEQFDGYFALEECSLDDIRARLLDEREYWGTNSGIASQTQIIKQADVIAMMALFPELFSDDTVLCNWNYYEPRTEHGSSLSACMYALTACRIGRPDLAWEHFMKAASIDLVGGGKHWAGEIYIGGTHPAANGGAWLIAVRGFAGLSYQNGEITLSPRLPEQIKSLRFPLIVRGKSVTVTVTHEGWQIADA
ncbi:MAG: glycoside hydrolase family 65 protein [Oscillospiraceae bacterium]|nr:glycoside hydrolase family 65 protein [Oscillospiraceae bacterium]